MSKPLTLKQMALIAIGRPIERFTADLRKDDASHQFELSNLRMKVKALMEKISNITIDTLDEAEAAGRLIEIDGVEYLPSDLRIIKEYRNLAAADPLVEAYDKKQSHHIPVERLFQPSLFPQLDYAEVRTQWLVLGETKRIMVGDATVAHWDMNDKIKDENWEAQGEARKKDVAARRRRKNLWQRHPGCRTTDDLIRALGGWTS